MALGNKSIPAGANNTALTHTLWNATVLVTGLGYFIDMFDMMLFGMTRVKSLTDLGLSGDALTDAGLFITNCQWGGIFLGAYVFGVLGDKIGRKKCLFSSILIYSLGSLASSLVQDINTYALIRFITGFGLAGELGMGVTLIAERLKAQQRGYGAMIFLSLGFLGVLTASLVTQYIPWRQAYIIGGIAGLILMVVRGMLMESGLFNSMQDTVLRRGGLGEVLKNSVTRRQFIGTVLLMAPAVLMPQIMWTLSPELGRGLGLDGVQANIILGIGFGSFIVGDFLSMYASERLQSRKRSSILFLFLGAFCFMLYFLFPATSWMHFYIINGFLGLAIGSWMIGAIWIAEQFGTNVRATVSTAAPNFARGITIPMNLAFAGLKVYGALTAAAIIGATIFALAYWGWKQLPETYGKDLDYYHD